MKSQGSYEKIIVENCKLLKKEIIMIMIERLAKKYKKSALAPAIVHLLPKGQAIHQYLIRIAENTILFDEKFNEMREVLSFTEEIDSKIRPAIREHRLLKQEELTNVYCDLLHAEFKKHNIDFQDFLEKLKSFNFLKRMHFDQINIDLLVNIEKNFEKIMFKYNNAELLIENPKLLWDCHCATPIGNFEPEDRPKNTLDTRCPIHSDELGAEVSSRFMNGLVQIQYDGIKVLWHDSEEFWPPSIDTIRMYENLKSDGVMKKRFLSILDIGSGTGFLGISLAKHNPYIQKLYLSDWLLTPVVFSKINWEINRGNKTHVSCIPLIGMEINWLNYSFPVRPFDICICNPPYLPSLKNFPEVRMSSTVAGTDLLEYIIKEGHKIARETYINFSSIAEKEAISAANKAKAKLVKIGESYKVPFRVPQALKAKNYVQELSEKRGLKISEDGRYKYWHTVSTYKIIYEL